MTISPAWTHEHASLLVTLRQEKGLDHYQLAKLTSLSPQQVAELEDTNTSAQRSAFYSPEIKSHAGHRLIEKLRTIPATQA